MITIRLSVLIVLVFIVKVGPALCQSRPKPVHGYLAWHATLKDADITPPTTGYRLYAEAPELVISLAFVNESPAIITLDSTLLASFVRVSLSGGGRDIPASVVWVRFGGSTARTLPSGTGVAYEIVLRPAVAPIRFGEYVVTTHLDRGAPSVISPAYDIPFDISESSSFTLVISAPRTARERAAAFRHAGRMAADAGRLEEAVTQFRAAVDADINDKGARNLLGMMYLQLGRYRDAADSLEVLMRDRVVDRSIVPQNLAESYIGLGDDAKAANALSVLGWSDAAIAKELARLREVVTLRTQRR